MCETTEVHCLLFPYIAFSVALESPLMSAALIVLSLECFFHLTFQWKSKKEKLVCESLGAAHRHERSLLHFIFTRTLHTTAFTIGLLARSHCLHLVNSAAPLLFPSLALSPPRPTLTVSPYCCCSQYNRAFLSDASACVLTFLNIST